MEDWLLIGAGINLACAVASAIVARSRGLSPAAYFAWGAIVGPLGVLFAAASKRPEIAVAAPAETGRQAPRFSIEALDRLASLRAKGDLTDAEFAKAKERLLNA